MLDERRQARVDLAAAYQIADLQGLGEGICNHFTVLVPGTTDQFYLVPHGLHWSEVTASSLLAVSVRGEILEGTGYAEPTAFHIHAPLHQDLPAARCVLHTHMPHATALTMLEDGKLEMSLQTALLFHGKVAYDDAYAGLALDSSEGHRLARVMGSEARVLFLKHHGVIVIGPSVAAAYHLLYYLERVCQTQILALSTGRKLARIPDEMARSAARQIDSDQLFHDLHFAALKRVLDRERPGYLA